MTEAPSSPLSPETVQAVARAAVHLEEGHCVAMPTETVYGLAARVDSPEGIRAIFHLKERPSFDPLIVHIADFSQVHELASVWPETAAKLAGRFWPGPLTLVVPKKAHVDSMITSGLETVGIRMPKHPVALALIRAAKVPLAAPSANRFGRTSPTTAAHVRSEFPDAIARGEIHVLEGGESDVGVESTVCLVTETEVTILRPGGITEEDLRAFFISSPQVQVTRADGHQASPGHTEHHYETRKPLIVSWGPALEAATYEIRGRKFARARIHEIELPNEPALAARRLYAALREGDLHEGSDALFIRRDLAKPENRLGLWQAIDDRLKRASRLQISAGKIG